MRGTAGRRERKRRKRDQEKERDGERVEQKEG